MVQGQQQQQQQQSGWESGMAARVKELMEDVSALDQALAESTSRERHLQAQAREFAQHAWHPAGTVPSLHTPPR